MGRLKDKLLQLEEEEIIEWSEEFQFYVLSDGDKTQRFDLREYLSTVVCDDLYSESDMEDT